MDKNTLGLLVEEAKAFCLDNGLVGAFNHARFLSYLGDGGKALEMLKESFGEVKYMAARRLCNSTRSRRSRAYKRIGRLVVDGWCWFLTLTFSDEVLAKTSHETRRRYVARYLKSLGGRYVANVDYGSKNGREHYHALIELQGKDRSAIGKWPYGYYLALPVGNAESDSKAVTTYVTKLTSHALKKSTTGSGRMVAERLIYGRGPRNRKIPPKWLVD